eukprot:scaffold123204_cov33-Tisochrysis_lutea.AAC.3
MCACNEVWIALLQQTARARCVCNRATAAGLRRAYVRGARNLGGDKPCFRPDHGSCPAMRVALILPTESSPRLQRLFMRPACQHRMKI